MLPRNAQLLNLNTRFRHGVYYSIAAGNIWQADNHTIQQCRLYYITSGKCTIWINGQKYLGRPGRCFFVPAGVSCAYQNDSSQPFSKYWLHFDLICNNQALLSALDLPPYADIPSDSVFLKHFQAIDEITKSDMLSDNLEANALLLSIFAGYIRLAGDMTISSFHAKDAQSKLIIGYIQRHLQENLTNAKLAAYMHMDVRTFIRFFKKVTDTTPARYIAQYRMSIAQELLIKTDLSISEIMYETGISDAPLFSKMFKRVYSLSPTAYRETYRHREE